MPHGSLLEIASHHNPCSGWHQEAGGPLSSQPLCRCSRQLLRASHAAANVPSCTSEGPTQLQASTRSAFSSFLGGLPSMAFEPPDGVSHDLGMPGEASPFAQISSHADQDAIGGDDPGVSMSVNIQDVDFSQDDSSPLDSAEGQIGEGPQALVENDDPMMVMGAPGAMKASNGPGLPPSGMDVDGAPTVGTVQVDYSFTSGENDDGSAPMLTDGDGGDGAHESEHGHDHNNSHHEHGYKGSHDREASGHEHNASKHGSKSDRIRVHENKSHTKHLKDSVRHHERYEQDSGHHPLIIINNSEQNKGYHPITVTGALVAGFAQLYMWGTCFVTLFKVQRPALDSATPPGAPQASQEREQGNRATSERPLSASNRFSGASGQPGNLAASSAVSQS